MVSVVGIRFKRAGKIYYFDPGELELQSGDKAVVETARGIEMGDVVIGPRPVADDQVVQPLKMVIRKANERDLAQYHENKTKEKEAFQVGLQKIASHNLEMKLVEVEYTFDGSKIIFYFTAEGRVDFRELVKDLASVFRTRIELRQIGVRDEAKMLGGLGCCGRPICCNTFLGDFVPVSIKMAKEQNLSLNPTKISGICGRLLCCLKYESEGYGMGGLDVPELGSMVMTTEGEGKVTQISTNKGFAKVRLTESDRVMEFPLDEIDLLKPQQPASAGCNCPKADDERCNCPGHASAEAEELDSDEPETEATPEATPEADEPEKQE